MRLFSGATLAGSIAEDAISGEHSQEAERLDGKSIVGRCL